jgi:hypothetical protein
VVKAPTKAHIKAHKYDNNATTEILPPPTHTLAPQGSGLGFTTGNCGNLWECGIQVTEQHPYTHEDGH